MHCVQQKLLGQQRPSVTHSLHECRLPSLYPAGTMPRNKVTMFQLLDVCLRKTGSAGRERTWWQEASCTMLSASQALQTNLGALKPSLDRTCPEKAHMAGKVGLKSYFIKYLISSKFTVAYLGKWQAFQLPLTHQEEKCWGMVSSTQCLRASICKDCCLKLEFFNHCSWWNGGANSLQSNALLERELPADLYHVYDNTRCLLKSCADKFLNNTSV